MHPYRANFRTRNDKNRQNKQKIKYLVGYQYYTQNKKTWHTVGYNSLSFTYQHLTISYHSRPW